MTDYIKSPLNYTGGKYKLLPKILPLFPKDIDRFIDLFCGGCNVAVNVKANTYICNDNEPHVIDFMNNIKKLTGEIADIRISNIVEKYGLSKENQSGFLQCRADYNSNKTWDMFYATVCHAFNYQIRYNSKGDYNMPFGRNRSCYNEALRQKFIKFVDNVTSKFIFTNYDFRQMNFISVGVTELIENDFVYCDPPYLITTASYNENGGWTQQDDLDLMNLLDRLNEVSVKWAMSNVLYHKGKINNKLIEWSSKYNIYHLDHDYSNCNYHDKTGNNGKSDEVLITNY